MKTLAYLFALFCLFPHLARAAENSVLLAGDDQKIYRLEEGRWGITTEGKVLADPQIFSSAGGNARIEPDGKVAVFQNGHWELSHLHRPPAPMVYRTAWFDRAKNLFVGFGGGGQGFNFVREGGRVVLATRVQWSDGTVGIKAFKKMFANPFGDGIVTLEHDGSVYRVFYRGNSVFHREPMLPPGSADNLFPVKSGFVVEKAGALAEWTGREFRPLPKAPSPGRFFSSLDGKALAEHRAIAAVVPLASKPRVAVAGEDPLTKEILDRRQRVAAFEFIRQRSEAMGVRAWLLGGAAASYGHYVKHDLAREAGDKDILPGRFNYDLSRIFLPNQDIDVVIDGNAEQAMKLADMVQENFPHFQGTKSAWEVRLLDKDMGEKEALLNNPNFSNQHTDSHSTGLIELTDGNGKDPLIRDLKDWNSPDPYFLRDLRENKLHFYHSPLHFTTNRAMTGNNPEIIAAIRYVTKANRHNLIVPPEDMEAIKKVVREFKPETLDRSSYPGRWMNANVGKLVQNVEDIEASWKLLDETGLRKKMIEFGNPNEEGSFAWIMKREPLPSFPVGTGQGRTAQEIFRQYNLGEILEVAHEADSLASYDSMVSSTRGMPNVLTSRQGHAEERALLGDGFYVKVGKEGGRPGGHTGYHARFLLAPDAREGKDFDFIEKDKFFVLKNRAAFHVAEVGEETWGVLGRKIAQAKTQGELVKLMGEEARVAFAGSSADQAIFLRSLEELYDRDTLEVKTGGKLAREVLRNIPEKTQLSQETYELFLQRTMAEGPNKVRVRPYDLEQRLLREAFVPGKFEWHPLTLPSIADGVGFESALDIASGLDHSFSAFNELAAKAALGKRVLGFLAQPEFYPAVGTPEYRAFLAKLEPAVEVFARELLPAMEAKFRFGAGKLDTSMRQELEAIFSAGDGGRAWPAELRRDLQGILRRKLLGHGNLGLFPQARVLADSFSKGAAFALGANCSADFALVAP